MYLKRDISGHFEGVFEIWALPGIIRVFYRIHHSDGELFSPKEPS